MPQFDDLMGDLNKHFGEEVFAKGIHRPRYTKIPFTSLNMNRSLYGGLPRGLAVEFSGEENSGKTTTALDVCGQAQKLFGAEWQERVDELEGKKRKLKREKEELEYLYATGPQKVLWVDCENTLDEDWARNLGVDVDAMHLMKPMSQAAEEIFEAIFQLIRTGEVGLVVIDSLGVMISAQEMDGSIEDNTYAGISAALTKFSKKVEGACARTNCSLIGINQLRDNMGGFGSPTKTTGGRAWRHVCCIRLEFKKAGLFDAQGNEQNKKFGEPAGNWIDVHIVKTKACKPDRRNSWYKLVYDTGIDWQEDYVQRFFEEGLILATSAQMYALVDPVTVAYLQEEDKDISLRGETNARGYVLEHPEVFDLFKTAIDNLMLEDG